MGNTLVAPDDTRIPLGNIFLLTKLLDGLQSLVPDNSPLWSLPYLDDEPLDEDGWVALQAAAQAVLDRDDADGLSDELQDLLRDIVSVSTLQEIKDEQGREHAPAGSSAGGQFTSGGASGGGGDVSGEELPSIPSGASKRATRQLIRKWMATGSSQVKQDMAFIAENLIGDNLSPESLAVQRIVGEGVGSTIVHGDSEQAPIVDRPNLTAAVQRLYDLTQKTLADQGITTLTVWRGMNLEDTEWASVKVGAVATIQQNPLSSWTMSRAVAKDFGSHVISMQVPARHVFATTVVLEGTATKDDQALERITGSESESEVVIIGDPALSHQAKFMSVRKPKPHVSG